MKIVQALLWTVVMAVGSLVCYLAQALGQTSVDWVGVRIAWLANKLANKEMPTIR